MENRKLLVDTSIIIDHLRKTNKSRTILYKIINKYDLYLSSITLFELYAGATNKQKQNDIQMIIPYFKIIPFDQNEAMISGEIYQKLKKMNQVIDVKDLLIASTALFMNIPLLTLNKKHFERIPDLELLDI